MEKITDLRRAASFTGVGSPERVALFFRLRKTAATYRENVLARLHEAVEAYLATYDPGEPDPEDRERMIRHRRYDLEAALRSHDLPVVGDLWTIGNLWSKARTPARLHAWASRLTNVKTCIRLLDALSSTKKLMAESRRQYEPFGENRYLSLYEHELTDPAFIAFKKQVSLAIEARIREILRIDVRSAPAPDPKPARIVGPDVPPGFVSTDPNHWELYASQPGAGGAARRLASAVETALKMIGRNVGPDRPDEKNAEYIRGVRKRLDKVLDALGDWGGMDGEPESHVRSVIARYLKLYLKPEYNFPKTYGALNRW